jgi:hypothetical protein
VKEIEGNLIRRLELMTNPSQTVRELEFFSLQLEQEFINIRRIRCNFYGKIVRGIVTAPQFVSDITSCSKATE